jgi:hypothetical protein
MVQQIINNPDVQKYANRASDSGFKLLGKGIAMATWGIITFVREMFKMIIGK